MKITKIRLWYNSLYALTSEAEIEVTTGKVFYKTNFDDKLPVNYYAHLRNQLAFYECFFLINKEQAERFAEYSLITLNWKSFYGIKGSVYIDGTYWNLALEMEDGSIREIVGENGEPDDFDEFVYRFEQLIKKQLCGTNRYSLECYLKSGKFFGDDGKVLILFPSTYGDLKSVDPDYAIEYDAVCQIPEFKTALFNYDEFLLGDKLEINPSDYYTGDCIYRGWMLKPEQYELLHGLLLDREISLINTPDEYNSCHLYPAAWKSGIRPFSPDCMYFKDVPKINWDIVNNRLKKFMIKDFVKSVKETNFPEYFITPVKPKEMDSIIAEFIELRGSLYTGGIVIKEFVNFKRYGNKTNEYRAFYLNNQLLSLARNSNQPDTCSSVPMELVNRVRNLPSKYYTVDFGELSDGKWIVIEAGDGQVSSLSPKQHVFKYFDDIREMILY